MIHIPISPTNYQPAGDHTSMETSDFKDSPDSTMVNPNVILQALGAGTQSNALSLLSQIQTNLQTVDSADITSSSTASLSSTSSDTNPLSKDLSNLEDVLSSGDLASAQEILSQIIQIMPPPPPSNLNVSDSYDMPAVTSASSTIGSNTLASDFCALVETLQSGDLTSAQQKYSEAQLEIKEKRQSYSGSFKAQVVSEWINCKGTLSELSEYYHVHPNQIKNWKSLLLKEAKYVLEDKRRERPPGKKNGRHRRENMRETCYTDKL
jgi:transposase